MNIDTIARQAGDLAVMHKQTQAAEKHILEMAQEAHSKIEARLEEVKGQALTDDAKADQYMRLTKEKGRLVMIMAQAKNNLQKKS